jgi:hippurate hydrolase
MTPAARREKKNAGGAGSEDFAYVSHEIPTVMVALAAGTPANGYRYPQHHPQVKFANEVLPVGSTVYAYMAIKWLEDQISG